MIGCQALAPETAVRLHGKNGELSSPSGIAVEIHLGELPPDSDAIRAQLGRVVASELLSGAKRLRQFLSFVVEETLDGRSAQIKEYVVGVYVYGKPDSYDPRTDSYKGQQKAPSLSPDGSRVAVQLGRAGRGTFLNLCKIARLAEPRQTDTQQRRR